MYKGEVCAFNFKMHVMFAFILWLFFTVNGEWLNPIYMFVAAAFPDCDHPRAPAGRILPLWRFFKHRGFTHTIWMMMITSCVVWLLFSGMSSLSWAVGYLSHLVLDSGTPSGVRWLGTWKKKKSTRKGALLKRL